MAFFKQFPQIDYDIQENGEISKIYDIYRHVDVVNKKTDDFTSYTFYEIKDGDRPDIISQKLYGTPDYYWTFFIINDFLQHGYNYFYKSYQTFMRGLQLEYEGKGALVVLPNYTNSFNVLGGIDITNDIINVIRKKTVNDYELVNMILRDDRPSINTVEVRRNVDGTEKVFTIDEVTDGTLEGFVNASFNDELPLDQATGAAAAYSLRKLKEDFTGDVVEVRRNVDGETEGFTAAEVTDGTLEGFVNASVDDKLPLDQSTGAAAAYSLRNLSSSYTGDVVEVRRNVDGETEGFTADEVTDGTLEQWVEGWELYPARGISETSQTHFNITKTDDRNFRIVSDLANDGSTDAKFITILSPADGLVFGKQRLTFDVSVNSGDISNYMLRLSYRDAQTNLQPVAGSNSFEIVVNDDGSPPNPNIYFAIHGASSFDVTISNLKVYKSVANELPLDQATGAAAAYSLRNLSSSYTGNVVEVRRSSDNAEEPFTAAEVADGTLEAWVNGDVDKLNIQAEAGSLVGNVSNETSTGFDFSVNNEGSNGFKEPLPQTETTAGTYILTFDVVLNSGSLTGIIFRSNSPGEETNLVVGPNSITVNPDGTSNMYFRVLGTSVADVSITNITLTQTTADGHVKTWYDQSGSDNDATQTTAAKQPKIVENGTYLGELDFDGTDDYLFKSSVSLSQPFTAFSVSAQDIAAASGGVWSISAETTQAEANSFYRGDNGFAINAGTTLTSAPTTTYTPSTEYLKCSVFDTTSSEIFVNGSSVASGDAGLVNPTGGIHIGRFVSGASTFAELTGSIKEIIIYDSDQSTKRRAIEENIANHYGITLAAFSRDGTVSTWYDQSGSDNDATQTDPAKQPKVVEGGVLVTRNGDAAIKSTSDNLMTFTLDSLSADGQQSVFAVLENDVTSQDGFGEVFKVFSTSTSTGGVNRRPYWYVNPTGGLAFTVASASGYQNTDREYRLYSHVMNDAAGGTSTVHRDGTQVDTRSITLDANATFSEGKVLGVTTNATGALYMSEVIYYPSDQTDKRRIIEENIANHYDITLAAFSRDGTVKTWYDQSGNTNDAVQTDATKQPKIVENGSVLEDSAGNPEIDFDGTSHRFDIDFGSNLPQPNSIFMVHQSDSVLEADNEFFDEKDTTGQRTLLDVSTVGAENRYRMRAKTSLSSTNIQVTTDKNLVSAIYNGSNSSMSLNGDSFNFTNTVGSDSIARLSSIGFSEGTGNYYDGTMQEFIIYNSDQSDKRRAIEENIANHYDITLADFSRDGTVKTWTYQIGTNDDPSSQPKIVVDGSLLTNNTQLSSLNEVEVMTVSDPISWNPHNLQLIVDNVTDESIFFDDSSIDRYSLAFKDSATSEQKVEWLKEFNEAQRELKGPTYINLNENTLSSFEFTAERRYEELITAPYSYYATIDVADRVSVGDTINAYDAARSGYGDLDQFTTYYQHEEDENELSRKLKVVRPQEIEQFTEQYKTLINS